MNRAFVASLISAVFIMFVMNEHVSAQQTTRGRDFFVSFLPNIHNPQTTSFDSLFIYVVAEQPTTGTITYSNGVTTFVKNFTIANPTQIFQFGVSWAPFELHGYNQSVAFVAVNDNEQPSLRCFRVQTTQDVAIYALNQATTTSDAALIYPVPALSTEYYVMSYRSDGVVINGGLDLQYTPSEFCVVATQDNTTVMVTPTVPTAVSGMQIKTVTLNKGQAWLCQSDFSTSRLNYDLTGTHIVSTQPVAVFSGHQRALIPVEGRGSILSRDQLFEQLPPIGVWGKYYLLTPLAQPTGSSVILGVNDLYRVVASDDNTVVRFNGNVVATLMRSQYFEAPLIQAGLLSASKKVMVGIYKRTHSDGNRLQNGDPFMMIVPPRSQYLSRYRFTNCQVNGTYNDQFITVITTRSNINSITLDGVPLVATFKDVPNSCYVYANVRMADGAHTIDSPRLMGLYVYGYGEAVSYGYVGGMAFVPDIEDDAVTAGPDQSICIGDSAQLKSGGKSVSLRWSKLGMTNRFPCDTCTSVWVQPSQTTAYVLTGVDSLGCSVIDTTVVYVNQIPTVDAMPDTVICTDVPVVLRAQGQFQDAVWSPSYGLSCTNCSNTVATPGKDMKYYVTVRNGNSARCSIVDSVTIRYRPGIANAFPKPMTICRGDSVALHVAYGGSLRWSPPTGLNCTNCADVVARPQRTTRYTVNADSLGCYSQAVVDVIVNDPPTLSMPHDTAVCAGESLTLSIRTNSPNIQWSPATYLNGTSAPTVTITPDSDITYTVVCNNGSNCIIRDSMRVRVKSAPRVSVSMTDTAVCEGSPVQLQAVVSNADSVRWLPTAGLSCTDCLKPIVTVSGDMQYTVVAYKEYCQKSASLNVRSLPRPTVTIQSLDTAMCGDAFYQLQSQSSAPVQWSPPLGLSCTDCPNPLVHVAASQTYVLTTTNANGCRANDSVRITILKTPVLNLSIDRDTLCQSSGVAHINVGGGTPNERITWRQDFGLSCYDCGNLTARPALSTVYSVLITSEDGCETSTTIPITVKPCSKLLEVDDADVGGFVACSTKTFNLTIRNAGEQTIRVDSVVERSATSAHVSIDATQMFPITLQSGQSIDIPATLTPFESGPLRVQLAVYNDSGDGAQDTVHYATIRGSAERRLVTLMLRSNEVGSGRVTVVPVEARSNSWNDINVDDIGLRIAYHKTWMQYADSVVLNASLQNIGWTVVGAREYIVGDTAFTELRIRGGRPLSLDGVIALPQFRVLLSTDFSFTPRIDSVWFMRQHLCVDATTSAEEIVPAGCVKQIRRVYIGATPFALNTVAPNPVALTWMSIDYSVGFRTDVRVVLVDALGRTALTLVDTEQAEGTYLLKADVSMLSPGVYYCRYTGASNQFVRSVVIQR